MINLIIVILQNILRYGVNKLRYKSRYKSGFIERLACRASVRLYDRGHICLERNVELAPYVDVQVHGKGRLHIGASTYMNRYCLISCHGHISIGERCMFGPGVKIFDNNHRFNKNTGVSGDLSIGEISIGNRCWIASDAIILKGARIGDNCVIAAGCIIDYDVPDNTIVRIKQSQELQAIR